MTNEIPIVTSGDVWVNPEQVKNRLNLVTEDATVILDLRSEGASLELLGVIDVVNTWAASTKHPIDKINITKWSNPVEFVPYKKTMCSKISHFFFMCADYWSEPKQDLTYSKLFGLFVGRLTTSRSAILYTLSTTMNKHFYLSRMASSNPMPWEVDDSSYNTIERIEDWLPLYKQVQMFDWYSTPYIHSVDNKEIKDQFTSPTAWVDTNTSLLKYYNQFAIELVCETYTLGNTFFPTEKTVRPLMAGKPMLVYGPKYYLARLRSLGFKTYHDLWDESYDLFQGPERWQRMQTVIARLAKLPNDKIDALLIQAYEIALHNRILLERIAFKRVDLSKHDYSNI